MNEFVDIVVLGEGEQTLIELARVIRESGLGFKDGGRIALTRPRRFIENLDELSPAWHLLDRSKYLFSQDVFRARVPSPLTVATIITSRGCPWRCRYCYSQKVNRRTFRAQSAEKSIQDILELKQKCQANAELFEDDNFFTDRERALEIVRRIQMPWSATFRASDIARGGRDLVRELKRYQCLEPRIGAESGSPKMLEALEKDLTFAEIRSAARLCEETGLWERLCSWSASQEKPGRIS